MHLALFDMDGTITRVDTTIDFVKHSAPKMKIIAGYLIVFALILLYWLKIITDTRGKEIFYRFFFGGWDEGHFREAARRYGKTRLLRVIRQRALERIQWHIDAGHRVAVVSAMMGLLAEEWCAERGIEILANTLEIRDGRVTGRLATPNCFGPEKERRVRERFNLAEYDRVYAYGDSRIGDRELLALADDPHFRTFE